MGFDGRGREVSKENTIGLLEAFEDDKKRHIRRNIAKLSLLGAFSNNCERQKVKDDCHSWCSSPKL